MRIEGRRHNRAWIMYVVAISLVLVLFSGIFLTYAWLKTSITVTNDSSGANPITDPTTHLGSVDVEIWYGGNKVSREDNNSITITCSGSTATRTMNLAVRNMGTVDALVRATISIYYLDANNNKVTYLLLNSPTAENQCAITNTGWVNNLAGNNVVVSGYMFYNDRVHPYKEKDVDHTANGGVVNAAHEVTIISQVVLDSGSATKTFYIDVKVDACAYAGNIYQKIEANETNSSQIPVSAYPFGPKENLPVAWTAWQRGASQGDHTLNT